MATKKLSFRTQYSDADYQMELYNTVVAIDASNPDENRTKQSFKDECDINILMQRYNKAGMIPPGQEAQYGDLSDVPTYLEAHERVQKAETAFLALPAEIRAECQNDPATFLDKVRDAKWAVKHGLAKEVASPPLPAAPAAAAAPAGAVPAAIAGT